MSNRISCTDTAKLVRAALKGEYPTVKFKVRSSSYSGGASIHVEWTDGPTLHQVERILHRYEGASFDGMIDLKSYHDSELNGEKVHFGADFVHGQRSISPALMQKMAEHVRDHYAVDHVPALVEHRWREHVSYSFENEYNNRFGNYSVADFIMQQCYAYDATTGMMWDNSRRCLVPFDMEERYAEKEAYYDRLEAEKQAYYDRLKKEREEKILPSCELYEVDEFSQYAFGS